MLTFLCLSSPFIEQFLVYPMPQDHRVERMNDIQERFTQQYTRKSQHLALYLVFTCEA
jgi:hypothetical protein